MNPERTLPERSMPQRTLAAMVAMALLVQLLPLSALAEQTVAAQYEYDAQGNLTKITDPNGKVTKQTPDNLDRITLQELPQPKPTAPQPKIYYTYDAQNRLTSVKDANGAKTTFTFPGLRDVWQQSRDTYGLFFTMDKEGNLGNQYNNRGQQSDIQYDNLNRPTKYFHSDENLESSGYTSLAYDTFNLSTGLVNYGRGHLTEVNEYGADGSPVSAISLRYDQRGRVTRRCQVIAALGPGSSAATCTDVNALFYRWGQPSDPVPSNIGRLLDMTYPSGRKVAYQYNALGQISGITTTHPSASTAVTVANTITYTPLAVAEGGYALKSLKFGATGSTPAQAYSRQYDTTGRTTHFSIGQGATNVTNADNELSYDQAGRVLGITSHTLAGANVNQSYGYDDLDRLTSATLSGASYAYDYDLNGNRILKTAANISTVYGYLGTSGRMASVTVGANAAQTVSDDTIGNITSDPATPVGGTVSYFYDNRNTGPYGRMVKTQGPGAQFSYLHNHFAQRIRKTGAAYTPTGGSAIQPAAYIGSTDTVFHYDLQGHLIAEQDAATKAIKREYIWLYDTPIAVIAGATPSSVVNASTNVPTVYYIHTDHLDTPRLVTDTAGNRRWEWSIATGEPFGNSPANEGPQGQATAQQFTLNLRFPGQYLDKETGTFYNYHRTYNPATGRYVQSDPIGLNGGLNTFGYVGGNPLTYSDPLGQAATLSWCMGGPVACAAGVGALILMSPPGQKALKDLANTVESFCKTDDPCDEIRRQIRDIEGKLASKEGQLAKDPYDLFNRAYSQNPGGDLAGKGTYLGHVAQISALKVGLARKIAEAKAMGCL